MPVYEYTGFDSRGKGRKGIINADSPAMAGQRLRSQGLYPSSIVEVAGEKDSGGDSARPFLVLRRVSQAELAAAIRQLATLLSAGLPLLQALDSILGQMKGGGLHKVLARVRERVKEGSSLAQALCEHPRVFDQITVTLVQAGEESGTLELVMQRLADFGEKQQELRRRVLSSLAYPVLMFVTGMGVLLFLMSYVIPQVTQIFQEMDQSLPWPTLFLIWLSDALQLYWWLYLPVIALVALLARRLLNTRRGRKLADRHVLRLPLAGEIVRYAVISRFARTLGTLISNGVPLYQALLIVRNVVSNSALVGTVDSVAEKVRQGESMSGPLSQSGLFPATVVQMVGSGEQSGNLGPMLLKVADDQESSLSARLTVFISLLEPIMILFLGAIVGFVVIAVLLPIFELSRVVG